MQSCLQVRTRIQSSLELLQEENSFAYYSRNWPNSTYLQNVTIVAEQRGALGVVSIIFAVHTLGPFLCHASGYMVVCPPPTK